MAVAEQFQLFRSSHAITHRTVSGHDWSFVASGAGDPTVVVLPGGGGDADSMFPVVAGLEQHCRVIAIGYSPTAKTADEIVEGVRAILDDCGVRHVCILGHSLGGMAARAFAQKYPERVDALIIANCAVYSPGRRLLLSIALPILARLPHRILACAVRSRFNRLLKNHPDREFWLHYVNQCKVMNPRSTGLRNQALCLLDFMRGARMTPAQTHGWNGRVLILESDRETGFTRRERQHFRKLYPGAAVHIFQQAGHLSFITHTDEFVDTVCNFLTANQQQGRGSHSS